MMPLRARRRTCIRVLAVSVVSLRRDVHRVRENYLVSDSVERAWNGAVGIGLDNQKIIELARDHCLNMEFVAEGSGGAVEASTGLPIAMRQVRCPVALGNMSTNLRLIATDFYREHCVGCEQRRPTGRIPNLAGVVDDEDAAVVAEAKRERDQLTRAKADWTTRDERRRALAVTHDEAMVGALADIGVVDGDPETPATAAEKTAALGRLAALADKQPQLFTDEVVACAGVLVRTTDVADELLDPLRRLALARAEFADDVVRVALVTLRLRASGAAGRCVADLADHVPEDLIDQIVCTALVRLAGMPVLDRFGRSMANQANDPTGLLAAATIAPSVVERTLRQLLPGPAGRSVVILPPTASRPPDVPVLDRAAAAGAVRVLATTHPALAAALVDALILDLGVTTEHEPYDPGQRAIEHTLAVLFVLDVGEVLPAILDAGRHGGEEFRQRLFTTMSRVSDMIASEPRWREPGDPTLQVDRRTTVATALLDFAIARLGGDWGDHVQIEAADLVRELVREEPSRALPRVPSLLGAVLTLVDVDRQSNPSALALPASESPELQALEALALRASVGGTISRVLGAVEDIAAADPTAVCAAITALIADERDTERGSDIIRWLLRSLGRIGSRHGSEPGVLRSILPILHSYLVDVAVALRAAAIDAWAEIGVWHELPSSLSDLVPALADDTYVHVARALTRAARRLDWQQADRDLLLRHALGLLGGVDPVEQPDAVEEALATAVSLVRDADEPLRRHIEQIALEMASRLGKYKLRDVLRLRWLPATERSPLMARLRLRQAADHEIVDRWNVNDDREICALLACGPGLLDLPLADLAAAALALSPDIPFGAAEFVEVAWRAARVDDAVSILSAIADVTPDNAAHAHHRSILEVLRAAADTDAAAAEGRDWTVAADRMVAAVSVLADESTSDYARLLVASASAARMVRKLLSENESGGDPAQVLQRRAEALAAAGTALAEASQQPTDTGAYLRAFSAACVVGVHLLKAEAAAFSGDATAMGASAKAASLRAAAVVSELTDCFDDADPLAGPLRSLMVEVAEIQPGAPASPILASWARLPIPVPVVRGSRPRSASEVDDVSEPDEPTVEPVAVVLASIDDHLVTGPQVVRHNRVYNLRVEVQVDSWPEWADRLDGEFLTHLTPAEITTPEFTWARGDHVGDEETYNKTGPLAVRFSVGAGQPSPPLLMRLAWRGERDGKPVTQVLNVAGHRELRIRPFDHARDGTTKYPVFDEHLLGLFARLAQVGYDDDQFQAFCRLLTAICRIGLPMTYQKKYRRGTRVSERMFHDDLHQALMADPELGGRVERGSPLALGYLDVRHDGITAELKVEPKVPVTRESARKYIGQPTQYAAADGARLSILTILDMSPKPLPVGTAENYLFTLEPRLHGMENPEAPSLVTVLIVNANMPIPSSRSRRKTPIVDANPS